MEGIVYCSYSTYPSRCETECIRVSSKSRTNIFLLTSSVKK